MKLTVLATLVVSLASVAAAAPGPPPPSKPQSSPSSKGLRDVAADVHFDKHGNLVSNVFDGLACVISNLLGGHSPTCEGKGHATGPPKGQPPKGQPPKGGNDSGQNQWNDRYNYKYDTNADGTLRIEITLDKGGSCTYNVRADGQDVLVLVGEAAKKCLAKET